MTETSLATALVAKNQAQTQLAVAAKFAKMNASADAAVGDLVEAANQNLQKLVAQVGPGLGQNLDISV